MRSAQDGNPGGQDPRRRLEAWFTTAGLKGSPRYFFLGNRTKLEALELESCASSS